MGQRRRWPCLLHCVSGVGSESLHNHENTGLTRGAETPELMAAAHLNRPYPPIYHTPQSNPPSSVASPSHDQHGRGLYGQPSSQMPQGMYGYPPTYSPMPSSGGAYSHQPPPSQHSSLSSQPLLMSHQAGQAQLHQPQQQQQQHQQPQQHSTTHSHPQSTMLNSPRQKPLAQTPLQRAPPVQLSQAPPPHGATAPPPPPPPPIGGPNSLPPPGPGQPGGPGLNPNAAPGPIPATTPLVVRQDNDGVQWIAFEYSRDRVKMEYTIRCDVESVNVDNLSQDFKTENCVYPRACCSKDQYRGNRLNYETECNTVGWALAELNHCLRGKRGLIQRAVDSWRNSNQDPRLRSRRVRRMAKINTRKAVQAAQHQSSAHGNLVGPRPPMPVPSTVGIPSSTGMGAPTGPGGGAGGGSGGGGSSGPASIGGGLLSGPMKPSPMSVSGAQLHHHHAHPDGAPPGGSGGDDVSGMFHQM